MGRRGYRPPTNEALHALCCDCMGNYADGRRDCQHTHCPFYTKHRYRILQPTFEWFFGPWSNHDIERRAIGLSQDDYLDMKLGNPRKPTYSMMFRAKCFSCCNNFRGGMTREDCNIPSCPIYYWMPYRTGLPILDWMFDLDYTDKHRMNARAEGYLIRGKNLVIIDRQRYFAEKVPWTGPPLEKKTPARRIRTIA